MIFEKPDGNLLTKQDLLQIQETEEKIMNMKNMQIYCLKTNGNCTKPRSILRLFDGTYTNMFEKYVPGFLLKDFMNFDNIGRVLEVVQQDPEGREMLMQLLDKNAVLNSSNPSSWLTMSIVSVGVPLPGYPVSIYRYAHTHTHMCTHRV